MTDKDTCRRMFDVRRSYLVLAPKTVRRGADFTVSASILHASHDVYVRAELKGSDNAVLVSNTTTVVSGNWCIVKLLMLGPLLFIELISVAVPFGVYISVVLGQHHSID